MASAQNQPTFRDGGSSNRPPCFVGEHYDFWKIRMQTFLEAQGEEIWEAIENGPYVPQTVINGEAQAKIKSSWTEDDKKKVLYDKRAKNILQSALGMDEFFRISHCKTAKEIWDTLQVTHEGTDEVKRSKLNSLSQEFEMFRMKNGETIVEMQKRFTHLTNHLMALGKTFTNDELNLKILRSLTRAWQPKVTAISEKKSLSKMTMAALFGKLQEHELELGRLEWEESQEKNIKSIALKVNSREQDSEEEMDKEELINIIVKKFDKFLNKKMLTKEKEGPSSRKRDLCFGCGKEGHIKADCPNLAHKRKTFNKDKYKKAYIAWEDNEISSSSESEDEEVANMALMALQGEDEESEVSSFNNSSNYSFDELQYAFNELHEFCASLTSIISNQRKTISQLEEKSKTTQVELDKARNASCHKCIEYESKIKNLNHVIEKYEKGQKGLNHVLSIQRPLNNKKGLGFVDFTNSSMHKTTFVKASTSLRQHEKLKTNIYIPPSHRTHKHEHGSSSFLICTYCGFKGHTPNTCYIRNRGIPNGEYMWRRKATNKVGPKVSWGPSQQFCFVGEHKVHLKHGEHG